MPGNYTQDAKDALDTIRADGQPLTFSVNLEIVDPVTGLEGAPSSTTYYGHGVRLTRYKGLDLEGFDNAFRSALVRNQAALFLVAAYGLATVPMPGHSVTLGDGTIWMIKGVTELNPAGQPIIYTIGGMLV